VEKSNTDGRDVGRVFLCLEFAHKRSGFEPGVNLIGSIPNREGTIRRHWTVPTSIPTEPQLRDICAWVSKLIQDAIIVSCGVQEALPLS
jgi:hypothetical protein